MCMFTRKSVTVVQYAQTGMEQAPMTILRIILSDGSAEQGLKASRTFLT